MIHSMIFNRNEELYSFEHNGFIYTNTVFVRVVDNFDMGINNDEINWYKSNIQDPRSIRISKREYELELQKSKSNY
jgi:hypothetical protein